MMSKTRLKILVSIVLMFVFIVVLPNIVSADVRFFVQIGEVAGNSQIYGYTDWIVVSNVSLGGVGGGANNQMPQGGGNVPGNLSSGEVTFTKPFDNSSMQFRSLAASAKALHDVHIRMVDYSSPEHRLIWDAGLEGAKILKVETNSSSQEEIVHLGYGKIHSTYRTYKADGTVDKSTNFCFDVVKNKDCSESGSGAAPQTLKKKETRKTTN